MKEALDTKEREALVRREGETQIPCKRKKGTKKDAHYGRESYLPLCREKEEHTLFEKAYSFLSKKKSVEKERRTVAFRERDF